jgi:uncharacterized membrane protein
MRNSYEAGDLVDLGRAEHLILGVKYISISIGFLAWVLSPGFSMISTRAMNEACLSPNWC